MGHRWLSLRDQDDRPVFRLDGHPFRVVRRGRVWHVDERRNTHWLPLRERPGRRPYGPRVRFWLTSEGARNHVVSLVEARRIDERALAVVSSRKSFDVLRERMSPERVERNHRAAETLADSERAPVLVATQDQIDRARSAPQLPISEGDDTP